MPRKNLLATRPFLHRAKHELPTLIYGVEGTSNQMQLVQHATALIQKAPEYIHMASQMLCWAWQQNPLDKTFLQGAASLAQQADELSPEGRVVASIMDRHLQLPDQDEDLITPLSEAAETGSLPEVYVQLINRSGHGLFWLGRIFSLLLDESMPELAAELLERNKALASLPHAAKRLQAELAMASLPPHEALPVIESVDAGVFGLWREAARASLLLQASEAETGGRASSNARHTAGAIYRKMWQRMPWHVNAGLTAYDLLSPPPPAPDLECYVQTCVLLYSWNKGHDLERTLESLANSILNGARVICLDNGSTDDTPDILARARKQWKERADLPELEIVRLPVNIGAPQARNWLLHHPGVRDSRYVAFLDDDVYLPKDWLPSLLAQAEANRNVSAVGCRIVRNKRPRVLQAADFSLLDPSLCSSGFNDFQERVFVYNNGLGARDSGLFRYTRPCISVTGCCHLLSMDSVARHGDFDIRFAPTQFDDLERDMRAFSAGHVAIYHGGLSIRHVQYSSLSQAKSPAAQSHVHGNKLKLEHKYEEQDLKRMAARCRRLLDQDFTSKALALDAMGKDLEDASELPE